jgi:hypothetical protein
MTFQTLIIYLLNRRLWPRGLGLNFKQLVPQFESRQGLQILSCEEAFQPANGTAVVLLRFPFVPEINYRRAPEVFLHQLSWKVAT